MKIQGMVIQLAVHEHTGTDAFGQPVESIQWEEVDNVLVSPASSEDINDSITRYGKKASYTLCIPKGDTHVWEDTEVEFYGKRWHTIGYAKEYIEANIPLSWNKQIQVEVIEG